MKLHPLTFALAEAPVDPFVPDGAQRFKVVVRSRVHGLVEVTGGHDTPAAALAELGDVVGRLDAHSRWLATESTGRFAHADRLQWLERWISVHERAHERKGWRRDR